MAAGNANSVSDSLSGSTKDTDLQQAELQQQDSSARAQAMANEFQMSYDSAVKLTQLSDSIQAATVQGNMTAEDREAFVNSAMKIGGITADEVRNAITQKVVNNDSSQVQALADKIAANLGMPSSAGVTEKLLPAYGLNLQ